MNTLVTGGCGFIGGHLVDKLLERGDKVTVIDDQSSGTYIAAGAAYHLGDIRTLEPGGFDVVYHLAAMSRIKPSFQQPLDFISVNSQGTAAVLELCRKTGARMVYAGTSSIYHDIYANPYTYSKWLGEEHCKIYSTIYGVSTVIARFFNVYGPRQPSEGEFAMMMGIFDRQKKAGQPLTVTGTGDQRRDFCVTGDTLVLMGDLSWKPISHIRPGELVVGFGEPVNRKRSFRISRVEATSSYISNNVYKINTPHGSVCATGNHPWLNNKGNFCDTDELARKLSKGYHAHLKSFGGQPIETQDNELYKLGYVVGSIEGDGYCYYDSKQHSYRSGIEVTDECFARRFVTYSADIGICLSRIYSRKPSYVGAKEVTVARSCRKEIFDQYRQIQEAAAWEQRDFRRGWVAGMFDSEGEQMSHRDLRLSNKDATTVARIRATLCDFGFDCHERTRKDGQVIFSVRGGLNEHVRFFATFRPAIARKLPNLNRREVKGSVVSVNEIAKMPASKVYNLQIEGVQTYIANGFLCHNTHVEDIVSGIIKLSEGDYRADIYNLGSGKNYSVNEVAAMFKAPVVHIAARPGEAQETLADISRTLELGWKPTKSLEEYVAGLIAT